MASKKHDGLYKRGRYWWASRDPLTGKKSVTTRCTDRKAARDWLTERERMHANPQYRSSKVATFGEWKSKYLASKSGKSKATQEYYRFKVAALSSFFPDDASLSGIDGGTVDEYVEFRRSSQKSPKDPTIAKEVKALVGILKRAKRKGCYTGDLDQLTPDIDGAYKPKERALSRAEVNKFLDALPSDRWRAFASLCIALGCRSSEAARLTADDIDMEHSIVWIDGRKTESSNRTLPILSSYRALVETAMAHLPFGAVHNVPRTFALACERAHIAYVTPNDLRRSHATLNSVQGLPDDMIARLLGHTSVSMAKRTYNRAKAMALLPVAERLLDQGERIVFDAPSYNTATESTSRIKNKGKR